MTVTAPPERRLAADVVVVGAGFAGLAAARELLRAGLEPVVLEARDRVGGRTLNEPVGDGGHVVEIGGQWIGPTQDRLYRLAAEMGVETYPTYNQGENLLELGGRLQRYRGTIPRLSLPVLLDMEIAQRRLERLARRVPTDAPWTAPGAARLDARTARDWLERNVRTRTGRTLFKLAIDAVWGADPSELSLLHVLFYVNAGGGFSRLIDVEGGAQQERFTGGSQLVAIRMAEELGERVVLGAPVRIVAHSGDSVTLTADGVTATGRRAVVAVPPALAGRIAYDPPLPADRDQLTQRMPAGCTTKVTAIYPEPFWRAEGMSGEGLSETGPLSFTYDNSPPDGAFGALVGFAVAAAARDLEHRPEEQRRRLCLDGLARLFGPRAAEPDRYIEMCWAREEWTRGCPTYSFGPGGWTAFGPWLRQPTGPIHWAGTETATEWCGYMEGALQSGERAAAEVAATLGTNAATPPRLDSAIK